MIYGHYGRIKSEPNAFCQAIHSVHKYQEQHSFGGREYSHHFRRFDQSGGWVIPRSGLPSLSIGAVQEHLPSGLRRLLSALFLCLSHCCSFTSFASFIWWGVTYGGIRYHSSAMSDKKCTPSPGKLDSEEEEWVQVWLRGLSKGLGPEKLVLKRGGRIHEGPDHGRIDVQPSIPLVCALSSQLVFEIGGV